MWATAIMFASRYWKPLALVLALAGIVAYHKGSVALAHHRGYEEGKAVLQPELVLANDNVKKLRDTLADQQRSFEQMEQARAKVQAAAAKALADEQAKTRLWQEQNVKLMDIINRPKATDAKVCARTDTVLRGAVDELR